MSQQMISGGIMRTAAGTKVQKSDRKCKKSVKIDQNLTKVHKSQFDKQDNQFASFVCLTNLA